MAYTCPDCGKVYPAPPKWCPCEPYPSTLPFFSWELNDFGKQERLKLSYAEFESLKARMPDMAARESWTDYADGQAPFPYGLSETYAQPGIEVLDTTTFTAWELTEDAYRTLRAEIMDQRKRT